MGFEDFDIPAMRGKGARRLGDETDQHVDTDGEVTGAQDRNSAGGLCDPFELIRLETRRPDDQGRSAGRRAQAGKFGGRTSRREIQDHVGRSDCSRTVDQPGACGALTADAADKGKTRIARQQRQDGASHAAIRAGDGYFDW